MKKKILIILIIVVLLGSVIGGVYFFSKSDEKLNYTVDEQRWLDNNKNNVVDFYMPSDIDALTADGEGLFFDFIDFFSKNTNVKINPVAYQINDEFDAEYSVSLVSKPDKDDIEMLADNYVVLTKENKLYNNKKELVDLKLGYLKADSDDVTNFFDATAYSLTAYDTKELMFEALKNDTINGIIGLRTVFLHDMLVNDYHVAFHIHDKEKTYVLRANGSDAVLNSIIKKEYTKFAKEMYEKSYNENLLSVYVKNLELSEKEMTSLNSKTYTYGYIDNGIYDNTFHKDLSGINYFIIKDFAAFANIDMNYADKYTSLSELDKALKNKKIDFYFDNTSFNLDDESKSTIRPIDTKIVFLTKNNNKRVIDSLDNLKGQTVLTIKNSMIEKWLTDNEVNVKSYDNYNELFKDKLTKKTIIAIELTNYEYYKTRNLSNFHIAYIDDTIQNYGFCLNDENEIFVKLFNFYLEYTNLDSVINIEHANAYEYEGLNVFLLIAVIILSMIIVCQFFGRIRKFIVYLLRHKHSSLTKNEKLKYIDNLTSLKNRAYLNDHIDAWDNSEIYPQIIIIIDLNNIAYINDNFGHEEGDKVITEAANILIQTQMPNTEIIRTDGNEFLIYMVEYEEKKAASYIRKLNREFKNLSHNFGAAIGYSIINDAIKTIDDAVNEATLDMKTNKEVMMEEDK